MNNKTIIGIIIAVIIIVAAIVGYIMLGNNNEEISDSNVRQSVVNTNNENSGTDETNNTQNTNNTESANSNRNILIAYFSETGNTEKFANIIHDQIGGDLFKIESVAPYPTGDELFDYTKEEQDEDRRPEIKGTIDISQYDTIFIGYPIWWYEVPQIIKTFLDQYDLSGKTIIPFNTHEGSGDGGTYNYIKEQEPNANVLEGLPIRGDLYEPKEYTGKLAAIAVCGPFGAVKEQASGLYALKMAERGFLTIAFDPSFTGESGGTPRYVASPDINTEDFSAAVDFLSVQDNVAPEKIGIIGICGWGGMALNTAAIDTRIKATVTSTMYDMSRVNANGYFDSMDENARYEMKESLNAQRIEDYKKGEYKRAGGVVDPLPEDAPFYVKDYYDYYKTNRGYHRRSLNSNNGWNVTSSLSFINMPILQYSNEIRSAVLMIHGEKAHSCYFSKDAFKKLKGDNKELMIIPNAVHTDLYDKLDIIPFDKIEEFFKTNLK